jgi:hypothetical protein
MADGTDETVGGRRSNRSKGLWYWLLLIPFIATLWVPFYNSRDPEIAGIPFFYWYLFLWIIISSVLTAVVYFVTRSE